MMTQIQYVIIIIINLIYTVQFDTNGILTALYIVITYMYTNSICARMNLHEIIIQISIHHYMSTHKHIHRHMYKYYKYI